LPEAGAEQRTGVATLQVGVDIVEISRVEASLRRFGDRFRRRVYTAGELAEVGQSPPSLAARFAAKEAAIKALGSSEVALHEIEVFRLDGGRPELRLHGRAAAQADALGVQELALSLAHSREYAVAMVVLRQAEPDHSS
jgi:holo-[acyl-carrier protein] synthase